jgi:Ceramidase
MSFSKSILIATLSTVFMAVIWYFFKQSFDGAIWQDFVQSKSGLTSEYCEFDNKNSLFRQNSNTFSNLIYFFVGLFIVLQCRIRTNKHLQNKLLTFHALSVLMGSCFIYLSFGSALFHASLTYFGQRVDMNGTYSISIALLGIAFYQLIPNANLKVFYKKLWIFCLLLVLIIFIFIAPLVSSGILIPFFILLLGLLKIITFFKFKKQHYFSLIILSFLLVFLAIKIRTNDVQKINCDPQAILQGHSIWHVLTALSSFCSYAYFRFTKKTIAS